MPATLTNSFLRPRPVRRDMVRLSLCAVSVLAVLGFAPNRAHVQPGIARKINGAYQLECRGYYTGSGKAAVGAQSVNITATVNDEEGQSGQVKAHLPLANNRFSGHGTVLGLDATFDGRVDPPDAQGQQLVSARITCTVSVSNGRHARLAGARGGGSGAGPVGDDGGVQRPR